MTAQFTPRLLRFAIASFLVATSLLAAPKILRVGNKVEPGNLDPQLAPGIYEGRILSALFEGLTLEGPDGKIGPGLAERWEISADRLTYTFHLRPTARWSDGVVITASEIVRGYQRGLTPALGADGAQFLLYVVGAEDYQAGRLKDFSRTGFKAIDDHTLQLTLVRPAPFFLRLLSWWQWYPLPMHVIDKLGSIESRSNPWARPENFVGNGAFILKSWHADERLVVSRSPTYWDRAHVALDEIELYPVTDADTEERMFRTGQLHMTYKLPPSKIPTYRAQSPSVLHIDPFPGLVQVMFNLKRPPFDDVRLRRAFALALDREQITRLLADGSTSAYQIVPPNLEDYQSAPLFSRDVPEAQRLLREAGYPDGAGFPRVELLFVNSASNRPLAEAAQQMWRKQLGVDVALTTQEWRVFRDSENSGQFQLAMGGWSSDIAQENLTPWQTGNVNNLARWSSPEFDRLLGDSLSAPTPEKRTELCRRMETILIQDMPTIPIYFATLPRAISPKVLGFRTLLDDTFPWKDVDLAP